MIMSSFVTKKALVISLFAAKDLPDPGVPRYHQMEDLIMIYLVSESEVAETYDLFYGEHTMADFRTEKYLNRIVTSANQLVEKIQIFDAGKDDRIMELVKLLAADSILKNDPDEEFDELRFAVDNDGTNILVIINEGEITGAVDIDNMYEFASSHCDDFKDLRDDEDIVINQEWIPHRRYLLISPSN